MHGGVWSPKSLGLGVLLEFANEIAKDNISNGLQTLGRCWGDPHLVTFDNVAYDFQGAGEFVFVQGTDLELQIRTAPWTGRPVDATVTTAVAMQVGDAVVGLYRDHPGVVNINGEFVEIIDGSTVAINGGGVYRNGNSFVVTNERGDGFFASYHGEYFNLSPFLCDDRGSDVSGLLGNNDGDRTNDIALPDGTTFTGSVAAQVLYGQFADAWRVTDETTLFVYGEGESTATYTIPGFPNKVITFDDFDPAVLAAAEQVARDSGLIEGTHVFNNVVFDIALTGDTSFAEAAANGPQLNQEPEVLVIQEAPELVDDVATTNEDQPVLIDVLANDSDPEGDTLIIISAEDSSGGNVSITLDGLLFTPAPDFNGPTDIAYTVSDGNGNQVIGNVAVDVLAQPDVPVVVDDRYVMTAGTVLDIAADAGLLINDFDVDGDQLQVTAFDPATNGTLSVGTDGAFSYTPNAGFGGKETVGYTISDGSATATASLEISVGSQVPGVLVNTGGNAVIDEGNLVSRTINFSDAEDTNADGWTYSVDYGDGSAVENGSIAAGSNSFDISHTFADGDADHDVSVTVTDVAGDSDTKQFAVHVNNVVPAIALAGAAEVNTGVSYTLNLGAVTDPGDDTVTSYIVDWGDGNSDTFNTAGDVTHTYAAAGNNTISVDLVDEDGTHAAGTLDVNVVIPTLGVSINPLTAATIDEGNLVSRTISFSDGEDTNADGWAYSVDYGDGSAVENGSIAAGSNSFDISHTFADGDADHDVSVTVTDVAGDSDTKQFAVHVDNVVPAIALAGAAEVNTGVSYTLT